MREVSLSARFWMNVERTRSCWLFDGEADEYGTFWLNGRMQKAHRVAWLLERGPIPRGKYVLHECDMRGCVRPRHLWLGTYLDNLRDCMAKGRFKPTVGEINGNAKLSWKDVKEIRVQCQDGVPTVEISSKFGVSPSTIRGIASGRRWRVS